MDIWKAEKWRDILQSEQSPCRTGLYLRFDKGVDSFLREECKDFAKWLRQHYSFPVRVPIYFKNKVKLLCADGDEAFATFFMPDSYRDEPYIRVAVGDYPQLREEWGTIDSLYSVLSNIAHELTHYFQWINGETGDDETMERQASIDAGRVITMGYQFYWEQKHPEFVQEWMDDHTIEDSGK